MRVFLRTLEIWLKNDVCWSDARTLAEFTIELEERR